MILPINNLNRRQQKDIPIHNFLSDGHPVSTDKINSHFISDMDPSICDIGCSCDELFEQDIECEIAVDVQKDGVQSMQRLLVVFNYIILMKIMMIILSLSLLKWFLQIFHKDWLLYGNPKADLCLTLKS
jgi:hypothetical protein